MPNLDPWINQQSNINEESTTLSQLENHLLSIRYEHQNRIGPKHHPTYNERQQKIIDMIDWTTDKYKTAVNTQKNQQNEQVIIDNIIEELGKKREVAITKKQKAILKDEVLRVQEKKKMLLIILFS